MPRLTCTSLLIAALLIAACGKPAQSPVPLSNGPAEFAGSASCQSCHAEAFNDWVGSHHELAMQVASADSVLGDFDDASFEYFGTTTRFFTRDDGYYVETADASGQDREFRITYTFGVEPLQQYLIEFPGGRLQTLAFSWDTRPTAEGGQRWFHAYGDEYIAPDDELHWTGPQQNWNYMCAECHSTNLEMGFDAASDSFNTTYSEISVGCEGCHGPGSAHVELANAGIEKTNYGLEVDLDDRGNTTWIMNPDTGIAARSDMHTRPQQQPEACGRCHSRRGIIAPDYEYGEPLAHTHMPALLEENLYFADGQILDEVYVYGSFVQSKMYQAGVSCTDCHNPHSAKLVGGDDPNAVCAQCHLPTKFAAPEHASHTPEQAGCVDCHMASRTYMVVDDRRDHSFRVPRPDLTGSVGTPNACDACHADRDANWATAAITTWRGDDAWQRPHFAAALEAGRHGSANDLLLNVISGNDYPGIARATAVSLLAQPFSSKEFRTLEAQLGNADVLIRIATLRQLRNLPPEFRLRLPGSRLLADPVRGVRIEAVSTYAGMQDLLPLEDVRAYSQAERDYRETYEAIANRPEALLALAAFETAEGRVPEALELYQTALRIEPLAVSARVNLADLLRGLGREAEGEDVLREGLELDATNAALHYALGLSLVRSSRTDAALEELRRAADLEPGNPRYAYVLGIALNSLGLSQEALQVLQSARGRFEGDFDIAMALANMLRDSGDAEAALEIAYTLARRHPENQNVLALLRSLNAIP
jgi:predicted CXXCH cytochrome family protein